MATDQQKIKCPKCGESISIDDVLTHQIEEKIKIKFSEENKIKETELENQRKELEVQKVRLEESQKNTQIEINKKVNEKLATEKVVMWKNAQAEAEKQKGAEIKLLEEQMKEKDKKLTEANEEAVKAHADRQKLAEEKKNFELEKIKQIEGERKKIESEAIARVSEKINLEKKILEDQLTEKEGKLLEATKKELEVRQEKNKLEEAKKSFELEKQRELDEAKKQIEEDAIKKATESEQYKIAQLEKKISEANKVNDDLRRKLEQGSQQTQGEVLELELEELLKTEFPADEVVGVRKGTNGADIIQKVFDKFGHLCGQIIWEAKYTKTWSENYVQKLKDDQREAKADLAVIVSKILPVDAKEKGFIFRDGVWICDIKMFLALATALRMNLYASARERAMSAGKKENMEILYNYLTGVEFKQRVEAIVEAFSNMKTGLEKEKTAFQKIWAEREKQIGKVINNTVGLYGDLSGLAPLQQIKTLELGDGESELTEEKSK